MTWIGEYRVGLRGSSGGLIVQLPAAWVRNLGVNPRDVVTIYRDKHDRLIIVPPSRNTAPAHAERTKGVRS